MPVASQRIQQIICTQALSTLTTVVPGEGPRTGEGKPDTAHAIPDFSGVRAAGEVREGATASPLSTGGVLRHRQVWLTSIPLAAADLISLLGCYLIGTLVTLCFFSSTFGQGVLNNLFAIFVSHMIIGGALGLFPASGINPVCELRNQLTSIGGSFLTVIALNGLVGEFTFNEVVTVIVAFPLSLVLAPAARFLTRKLCARRRWWGEKVIIVGSGQQGRLVYEFLERQPQRGLKPLGIVDDDSAGYWMSEDASPLEFLGNTSDLVSICEARKCFWVIAAVSDKTEAQVRQILSYGSLIPNLVVLSNNLMMPTLWVNSFDTAGLGGVLIQDRLLFPYQRVAKRAFDIVASAAMMLILSPLILLLALMIRKESKGPIFYAHERIGRGGRRFLAYKIRSMVPNAAAVLNDYLEANPEAKAEWARDQKLKNDPRIIPGVGNFLRKTSLDEIPQLWNVFRGDMSLVGPRPIVENEIDKYRPVFSLYLRVRPGLTGLWQVSGRNNTTYDARVRLDTYYVRNWSLWLDYFILLRTIRTVVLREGSY